MASTQLSERLGTNNQIYSHDTPANVKRSEFPLSSKTDFHLDAGMIVPIKIWETLPNDTFDIDVQYIIKSFPLVVAPFTGYKVRTHWYYCKMSDLWRGAQTMMTKGNSQNIELTLPTVTFAAISPNFKTNTYSTEKGNYISYTTPQSLMAYLGLKPESINIVNETDDGYNEPYGQCKTSSDEGIALQTGRKTVNALPFMMYQKIYRYAYTIPNLLQDSKAWYPDDLTDGWRINYNKTNFSRDGRFHPTRELRQYNWSNNTLGQILEEDGAPKPSPSAEDKSINLKQLRYGLFEEDRFTTAIPSTLRGTNPTISVDGDIEIPEQEITIPSSIVTLENNRITGTQETAGGTITTPVVLTTYSDSALRDYIKTEATRTTIPNRTAEATGLKFSLNQFRTLVSLTVWQERNMRIQAGDYNQFIYAHFKHNPKVDTHEPIYIGGSSDIIYFNDVVQTSQGTAESPLGASAGNGAIQGRANIGRFTCSDYGYIMGVMIIQPETVYADGMDKLWLRQKQEDFYFPEDEGLGMEEIFNYEIYSDNTEEDFELFGYNERNTEYKAFTNKAKGFFALKGGYSDLEAYSQARVFNERPRLSHQMMVMSPENMRRDMLAVPTMPMFRCSFATMIRGVRPMAYKNIPQTFGF